MTEEPKKKNVFKLTASGIALVAANTIPLLGVIFLGWKIFPIVFLYWLENAIIGFYTMMKMILSRTKEPAKLAQKIFMVPFFWVHYGGFMMCHGVFVFVMFGGFDTADGLPIPTLPTVIEILKSQGLFFAAIALFVSHGFSFYCNFIRRGERDKQLLGELMASPYKRVVVLHLFIIFGGLLLQWLKAPHLALALLVVMKTIADLLAHGMEHEHVSLYKKRIKKMYDGGLDQKGDENPFLDAYPGYTRHADAERRRKWFYSIGCGGSAILAAAGIFCLMFLDSLVKRTYGASALGTGIALGIVFCILYNLKKGKKCPLCSRDMEIVELDHPPSQLTAMHKMQCYIGPNGETYLRNKDDGSVSLSRVLQRWFVCHRCKIYFIGIKFHNKSVATKTAGASRILQESESYIDKGAS